MSNLSCARHRFLRIINDHPLHRIYFTGRFVVTEKDGCRHAGTAEQCLEGGGDCDCLSAWWNCGSERGREGEAWRGALALPCPALPCPRRLAYYDVALHEAAAALLLPFPVRRRTRERQLPPIRPCTFPSFAFRVAFLLGSARLGLSLHPLARSQRSTVRRTRTVQKPLVPTVFPESSLDVFFCLLFCRSATGRWAMVWHPGHHQLSPNVWPITATPHVLHACVRASTTRSIWRISFSSTSTWPASLVRSACSVSSPRP